MYFMLDGIQAGFNNTFCRCENFAFGGKPFVALWNSPTIGCDFNFSTPVHLKKYGILENDRQTWDGKQVTVFASAQLGLYPYFVMNGEGNYNGGLPQVVDLNQHLRKARLDIVNKIPDPDFKGVAVIDWEPWRPLWETNWNKKRIYKVRSVELVRNKHPDWPLDRLIQQAKQEFEDAGRAMFEHTITLGKELRPKALWGFYGFPDCFAHAENRYQCTPKVRGQNDKLEWLFSASTALFPSMYLLDQHPDNQDYVLGRLRETLRFASKGYGQNRRKIPIFVYHRNIYENNPHEYNFLTKEDLDNTVGAAAGIGAAGIVIWGNRFDENTSPEVCRRIDKYVATTFGPYFKHAVNEIKTCSTRNCNDKGHCVKKWLLNEDLNKIFAKEQAEEECTRKTITIPTHKTTSNQEMKSNDKSTTLAEGHYVDHNAMDDFFQILNGTTKPTQTNHESKTTQKVIKTRKITTDSVKPKITQINQQKSVEPKLLNKQQSKISKNENISRVGVKLKANNEELMKEHDKTEENVKKSNIPHPITHSVQPNHMVNDQQKSELVVNDQKKSKLVHHMVNDQKKSELVVNDQKKSELVHRFLSSVHGSLVTSSELIRKQHTHKGTSNNNNSSRKSQIMKSPESRFPLISSTKKSRKSWLPHMYVILIGVSLGGALMFSLVFVAVYYYISLRNTFPSYRKEKEKDIFCNEEEKPIPPKSHSSPKVSETHTSSKSSSENSLDSDGSDRRKSKRVEGRKVSEMECESSQIPKGKHSNRRVRSVERRHDNEDDRRNRRSRSHSESYERRHSRGRSCESKRTNRDKKYGSQEKRPTGSDLRRTKSRKEKSYRSKTSDDAHEIEININDLR